MCMPKALMEPVRRLGTGRVCMISGRHISRRRALPSRAILRCAKFPSSLNRPELAGGRSYDQIMMAMEFKFNMGIASIAIAIVAYGVYLWQASKVGGAQPHPFSWLLWGIV